MANENKTVVQDDDINIDDFLPMPGADSVVTGDENDTPKPGIFSKDAKVDMSFLDEDKKDKPEEGSDDKLDPDDPDKKKPEEEEDEIVSEEDKKKTDSIIDELDKDLNPDAEEEEEKDLTKAGTGLVKSFNKLIEDGVITPFDDDKDISDYSAKDWTELIQANFKDKEAQIRKETPKQFFDALPEELKYAAMHVAKGGTDLKSVFRMLAQSEEVKELDVTNEDDQERIARQYLQATGYGSGDNELVEDQIREWAETGNIEKKAKQFKPKLDKMQEQILAKQLEKQEQSQQRQLEQKEAYMSNIYEALKPAELNGVKIDNKRQNMLWNELTTAKYESMGGKPTNLLGKLLEDYQFGKEPRYDLIAETLWLLQDPEDYKANIRKQAASEEALKTAKTLKTEEGRKLKSTVNKDVEDTIKKTPKRKTLQRKANIFKR